MRIKEKPPAPPATTGVSYRELLHLSNQEAISVSKYYLKSRAICIEAANQSRQQLVLASTFHNQEVIRKQEIRWTTAEQLVHYLRLVRFRNWGN